MEMADFVGMDVGRDWLDLALRPGNHHERFPNDDADNARLRERLGPLPQALAELAPDMAKLVAPVVEQVAKCLTEGQGTSKQPLTIPTLLTEASRSAGRAGVRVKAKREAKSEFALPRACTACGVILEREDRDHGRDCMPEEVRASAIAFRVAGRARLGAMRAAGQDPAHSDEANRQRGAKVARAQKEFREWSAEYKVEADPEVFRREILPELQEVSLGAMARATGLSEGYCSFIRRGIRVPHQRHWTAFAVLTDDQLGR